MFGPLMPVALLQPAPSNEASKYPRYRTRQRRSTNGKLHYRRAIKRPEDYMGGWLTSDRPIENRLPPHQGKHL